MGSPPRSFDADANECIMVWLLDYRILGRARLIARAKREAPSVRHPNRIECAVVHPAHIQDPDGGALVMVTSVGTFPFLKTLFAYGAYCYVQHAIRRPHVGAR